jgi:hypothetical protein
MTTTLNRFEGFVQVRQSPVQRTGLTEVQTYEYCYRMIDQAILEHRALEVMDQTAFLLRFNINRWLRYFHEYVGPSYKEAGLTSKDKTMLEHVIPVTQLVSLLITGRITIMEALYAPTCLLRKRNSKIVDKSFQETTPDLFNFWTRYILTIPKVTIMLANGQAIDINNYSFDDHYKLHGPL